MSSAIWYDYCCCLLYHGSTPLAACLFGVLSSPSQSAVSPGSSGLDDAGLEKVLQLAFSPHSAAIVQRQHDASQLAGEAFLRGQDAQLAGIARQLQSTPKMAGKVVVMHRSWDDATMRFFVDQSVLDQAQARGQQDIVTLLVVALVHSIFSATLLLLCEAHLGVPPEYLRLMRHNTLGVCVMNQRRLVRWSPDANDACEVVLPARIMMSNTAAALHAALESVAPSLNIAKLRELCAKVRGDVGPGRHRCACVANHNEILSCVYALVIGAGATSQVTCDSGPCAVYLRCSFWPCSTWRIRCTQTDWYLGSLRSKCHECW